MHLHAPAKFRVAAWQHHSPNTLSPAKQVLRWLEANNVNFSRPVGGASGPR